MMKPALAVTALLFTGACSERMPAQTPPAAAPVRPDSLPGTKLSIEQV